MIMEVRWVPYEPDTAPGDSDCFPIRSNMYDTVTHGWVLVRTYLRVEDGYTYYDFLSYGITGSNWLNWNESWLAGLDINAPCYEDEPHDDRVLDLSVREIEV